MIVPMKKAAGWQPFFISITDRRLFLHRSACPNGEHPYQKMEDGKPSSIFSLLKISNRYRFLLCVPSMTESCFCGFCPKTGLRPIFFPCENW